MTAVLDLAEATAVLREEAGDAVAVITMSPLGFWGDAREQDFKLLGTMGAAGSLGLGLALGAPQRPVWVIDGDGSLAMQLGVTVAIGDAAPANLLHVLMANDIYAVSGAQPVPGRNGDWAQLALGAGYKAASEARTTDELREALRAPVDGPRMLVVRCAAERPQYPPGAFAGLDPSAEAERLRGCLTG
jgi:thiamine pyrophosphate-dependent acetolactate synthase large subunit-like protein